MTPELKAAWLADLRSGKYPKTIRHLKDSIGYCCLGVLCETAKVGFEAKPSQDSIDSMYCGPWYALNGGYDDYRSGNELSEDGRKFFGIEHGQHDDLTTLNDENDTFDRVIEYIEKNL